jgi:hypothetical protein
VPAELPDVPILAIGPDRTSALGSVNGTLTNPGIGSLNPDEPISASSTCPRSTLPKRRG